MAIPKEAEGIMAAFFTAIFLTFNLLLSKWLQDRHWPYFFLAGLSSLCITLSLVITMICQKSYSLERREVKWVILRGFFGCGNNVLQVCAVLAGASVGSVGALASVNTVVAALLGRVVLGEALGKLHVLAMVFSIIGAVLISDPEKAMATMGSSVFGNFLALLAGISLGCMFISSRKSGGASSMMLTSSAMLQRWIVCWLLHFIPAVPDGQVQVVGEDLPKSLLLFVCLTVAIFVTNIFASVASKKCPAALSSTVMNGSQMACGYFMDILVFHEAPTMLTITGAAMMFLAVIAMALTRLPARTEDLSAEPTRMATTTSLASFAASEFAERQESIASELPGLPEPNTAGPRQRLPAADLIGVKA